MNGSFLFDFPFGRNQRFLSNPSRLVQGLVGGWSLSGVGRLQGGVPLVVVLRLP